MTKRYKHEAIGMREVDGEKLLIIPYANTTYISAADHERIVNELTTSVAVVKQLNRQLESEVEALRSRLDAAGTDYFAMMDKRNKLQREVEALRQQVADSQAVQVHMAKEYQNRLEALRAALEKVERDSLICGAPNCEPYQQLERDLAAAQELNRLNGEAITELQQEVGKVRKEADHLNHLLTLAHYPPELHDENVRLRSQVVELAEMVMKCPDSEFMMMDNVTWFERAKALKEQLL